MPHHGCTGAVHGKKGARANTFGTFRFHHIHGSTNAVPYLFDIVLVVDFSHPDVFERFLALYGSLPRAAPGSDNATRSALRKLPEGPRKTVLDLGCGPGAQTLTLAAALPESTIVAVDVLPSMVVETAGRSRAAGAADRVVATVADMAAPPVALCSQDLVWCEGAITFSA